MSGAALPFPAEGPATYRPEAGEAGRSVQPEENELGKLQTSWVSGSSFGHVAVR